jgi:hypothetical protein
VQVEFKPSLDITSKSQDLSQRPNIREFVVRKSADLPRFKDGSPHHPEGIKITQPTRVSSIEKLTPTMVVFLTATQRGERFLFFSVRF